MSQSCPILLFEFRPVHTYTSSGQDVYIHCGARHHIGWKERCQNQPNVASMRFNMLTKLILADPDLQVEPQFWPEFLCDNGAESFGL